MAACLSAELPLGSLASCAGIGHYSPVSRPSRLTAIIASVASVAIVAGVAGFVLRDAVDTDDEFDGHMVYGNVTELQVETQNVCITEESTTCARLLAGDLPSVGTDVRGWLVSAPASDDDGTDVATYWAFITAMTT